MDKALDNLCHSAVYSALPFDDSFRLLYLEPSSDLDAPIVCHLQPSRLSDHPLYHALSYSWKSDDAHAPPKPIRCNGHEMEIGSNLWHALRRLRQTDSERVVWADALCINQADTAERNHQVRQMGSVYSGADMVIIWLGEAPPAETGIDIAAGLIAMQAVGDCWLDNRQWMQREIKERQEARTGIPIEALDISGWSSRRLEPAEARAVIHIFRRAWFRRLWVVQEVILTKEALVMLGKHHHPWDRVGLAAHLVQETPEVAAVVGDAAVETYRAIESASKIHYTWMLCKGGGFPIKFYDLLVLTRGMGCQDVRDRIFGLLAIPMTSGGGMGGISIEPDYGLAAGEIYHRVAVEILKTADNLDLLSDCQHEEGTELPGECPSWVPQWHTYPHMRLVVTDWDVNLNNRGYQAAGTRQRELKWTTDGRPCVKGVEVARVVEASQVLTEDCFERGGPESVFTTTTSPTVKGPSLPGSSTPLTMPDNEGSILQLMAQTLSGLTVPGLPKVVQYAAALKKGFLRWSLPRHGVLDGQVEGLSAWDRRLKEAVDDLVTYYGTDEDKFVSWMKMVCANRRLFVTEAGEIGLGPGVMRSGDVVCVLYGSSVPIMLRRVGEAYAVVGECFLQGVMNGSAVGEDSGVEQSREVVERWFELV